jgi:hypothetical protein
LLDLVDTEEKGQTSPITKLEGGQNFFGNSNYEMIAKA